jgi:hypothetical protein
MKETFWTALSAALCTVCIGFFASTFVDIRWKGAVVHAAPAPQDYIYNTFQFGYKDYQLHQPPCASTANVRAAHPLWGDGSFWVLWECAGDKVWDMNDRTFWMRRYFGSTPQVPTSADLPSCPAGFVPSIEPGGCVPPDHPLAKK